MCACARVEVELEIDLRGIRYGSLECSRAVASEITCMELACTAYREVDVVTLGARLGAIDYEAETEYSKMEARCQ